MRWVISLFVAIGTLVGTAAWRVDRAGVVDTATQADVLVVLGARVLPDGSASPTLRARVEHAVRLFQRGLAPRVVFSGGVGDFGGSEASVACALAVQLGVPREATVVEEASHSTAQNAAFTARLLRVRGWTRAVLVTDPYHLPRATRLFREEGLVISGSPVLEAPRHRDSRARAWWTLREVAAELRDAAHSQ